MRSAKDIKRLIRKAKITINPEVKKTALEGLIGELEKSRLIRPDLPGRTMARVISKSRITKIAAAAVIVLAVVIGINRTAKVVSVTEQGELAQHETSESRTVMPSKTPADMVSCMVLNMAFRNGGMEEVEKQFEKAEEKVKPALRTRVSVAQLIRDLDTDQEI